ncbi:hypothetical protein GAY29_14555, partial [Azospirillum brasilense]|nr:hypothetical protein [Azospirillum brasilense]
MSGNLITGTEAAVSTTAASDQSQPSVAVLANGTQVVAWTSYGQDGNGYGIYARRLDANGQPLGPEFRVNSLTALNEDIPSVVALGNGGFMVFWREYLDANSWNQGGLFAQRYDANGVAVGSQITLSTIMPKNGPNATTLADGSVFVVWHPYSPDVYGQRFDAEGRPLTGVFSLQTYSVGGDVSAPHVTALSNGGYVVTWATVTNGVNRGWDVYAQVYSAGNTAVGGTILVSNINAPYEQKQSAVAGLADGGFVVVSTSSPQDGSGNGIFLKRYSATGQLRSGEVLVNSYTYGDQQQPSVVALADGGYMVAWTSADQDGSGYGVYAQRFDAAGNKVGGDFLLEQAAAGHQVQPALAARPDGGFVAAWAGQDGSGYGVKVREFTASGTAPVFETETVFLQTGHSTLAAALLRPDHAQGDAFATTGLQRITRYEFVDTNASTNSGHFELDGVAQASGQTIAVTGEELGGLRFVAGSTAGTDSILVRVSDGIRWSDWEAGAVKTLAPSPSLVAGDESAVNTTVASDQSQPSVAVLANGTQVVAWTSYGQDGNGYGIYARRLDANGQPLGPEFRVNSLTALNEDIPSVVALGDGGFMVFWREYLDANSWNQGGVFAQRYDANGVAVGSQITLTTTMPKDGPRATTLVDGSVIVVWYPYTDNILAQRFDAEGRPTTGAFYVNTYNAGGVGAPHVTALSNGGYVVTWTAVTNGVNRGWDVYAQVYSAGNTAVGGTILVSNINAPYEQKQSA